MQACAPAASSAAEMLIPEAVQEYRHLSVTSSYHGNSEVWTILYVVTGDSYLGFQSEEEQIFAFYPSSDC